MQTQTQPSTIPTTGAVVTHDVTDYAVWKRVFDEHASARRKAGIVATHINRHADDPNRLSVYLAGTDAAALGPAYALAMPAVPSAAKGNPCTKDNGT